MYGGCALSTEQSEALPRAADARVGWRAFVERAAAGVGSGQRLALRL